MPKFKVGDRVKVISQNWGKPSLVGQVGTIDYILENEDNFPREYLICFDNWSSGHNGHGYPINNLRLNNCWFLCGKAEDRIEKVNQQLELNFNA